MDVASGGELARFMLALKVQHLRISKPALAKAGKEKRVATSVSVLAAGERREEIARMLSGAAITEEARAAAARLPEGAGQGKRPPI